MIGYFVKMATHFIKIYKRISPEHYQFTKMAKKEQYANNSQLQRVVKMINDNREFTDEWLRYERLTTTLFTLRQWKKLRKELLDKVNHLCENCLVRDLNKPANQVDHIIPRVWIYYRYYLKEPNDNVILNDWIKKDNLQVLCGYCHQMKMINIEKRIQLFKPLKEGFRQILHVRGQLSKFEEWQNYIKKNYAARTTSQSNNY